MIILPAIDLLDSKAVRLEKGRENSAVIYSRDPAETAKQFEQAGAAWIHVVDLDGAFGRAGINKNCILNILKNTKCSVQLGGGIRSYEQAAFWLKQGADRVILGTAAAESGDLIGRLIHDFGPDKITAALDLKNGIVSIHGWQSVSEQTGLNLAIKLEKAGLIRAVVTDIDTDGMLRGPKLDEMLNIARMTNLKIIVSGGISNAEDISRVAKYKQDGFEGVIIGKAIYEKRIDLKEVIGQYHVKEKENARKTHYSMS